MGSQECPEKAVDILLPQRKDEQNKVNKREGKTREQLEDNHQNFVLSVGWLGNQQRTSKKGRREDLAGKVRLRFTWKEWLQACQSPCGVRLEQGLPAELQVPTEPGLVTTAICVYLEHFVLGAKVLFGKRYRNVTACPVNINAARLTLGQPQRPRV